jgi:hypothetical protein
VLLKVDAPVTTNVFDRNTLPVIVVFEVFATIRVTVEFPVIDKVSNVELDLNVELPVIVAFVFAFKDVDVTFVVEALTFKKFPEIFVFPLTALRLIELVDILRFEKEAFALTETRFAPL